MKLSEAERRRRIESMLLQIAPESSLERLREELQSAFGGESLETLSLLRGAASASESLDVLRLRGIDAVSNSQLESLEAIIHRNRPAVFVIGDAYETPPVPWTALGEAQVKARIEPMLPSIGRIELPGDVSVPYGGSGLVVGPGLVMTNRHVAELFSVRTGRRQVVFKPGRGAAIHFRREIIPTPDIKGLAVTEVVMIHPYWDMAVLRVEGLSSQQPPLLLSSSHLDDWKGRDVVVIGYPAQDARNDLATQNKVFRGVFDVKRLLPGKLRGHRKYTSYERIVDAATHDASTLGGSSGSAVILVETGQVIGLHFAGEYLDANFAVPMFALAGDPRVVDAGVVFAKSVSSNSAGPVTASRVIQASVHAIDVKTAAAGGSNSESTWIIPLRLSVSVGTPQELTQGAASPPLADDGKGPQPLSMASHVPGIETGPGGGEVSSRLPPSARANASPRKEVARPAKISSRPSDAKSQGGEIAFHQQGRWRRAQRAIASSRSEIANALLPRCDEEQLKSTVWYIEADLGGAVQRGTGVVIRIRMGETASNYLLTCRHVVCDLETGAMSESIRCWPHASGYNPDSNDTARIWRAVPLASTSTEQGTTAELAARDIGSFDWMLLEVQRDQESFDAVPFAPGFAAKKSKWRQQVNPYRLVGFPGGPSTMHRDVVRASVSRDFRLSGLDAKAGLLTLEGPEDTVAGFSGGPYFDVSGKIVALHRSTASAKKVAVHARTIETILSDRGWQVIEQDPERLARWLIRVAALILVAAVLSLAWLSTRPPDQTAYTVEECGLRKALRTGSVQLVGNPARARIEEGVLYYAAEKFDFHEYDRLDESEFIATDKLAYRRRLFGLPSPAGTLTIRVRKHERFTSVEDFYRRLRDETNKDKWSHETTRPVISIDIEPDVGIEQSSNQVLLICKRSEDPKRIELVIVVGRRSLVRGNHTASFDNQAASQPALAKFNARYVYLLAGNPDVNPRFNDEYWKLFLGLEEDAACSSPLPSTGPMLCR